MLKYSGLLMILLSSVSHAHLPDYQMESPWFKAGQSQVDATLTASEMKSRAKNVIIFIGDGMGVSTQTAARIYTGQQQAEHQGGEEFLLSFEHFPYRALAKTYNTDQQTPDSAGTMTAMMTGIKTRAGMIGVSDEVQRGDCDFQHAKLDSLLYQASRAGLKTGIITTTRVTHATPAATFAHVTDRNWESSVSDECESVKDIALQLVEDATYLDLVMGGGLREFLPNDHQLKGKREDGRNLIEQWQNVSSRALLLDAQALRTWQVDPKQQVLGLFNTSHMAYEIHRNPDREPSLSEMTAKALDYFIHGSQDFVLMVESGRIDHGHHAGIAKLALTETEQLHHTVEMTVERLRQANLLDDTLIIVTADHSHVMTISGYQSRGTPILGLVSNNQGTPMLALDGKPMTTLSYANGPGARQGSREDLSLVDTFADDFQQPALVPLSSETHAGEDVAIHATGPGSQWFQGLVEQNYVFHVINHALALNTSIQ